jgi:hypothetical protein
MLLGATTATILLGCERLRDAADAAPYEGCDYASVGEPCGDGPTTCRSGARLTSNGYCSQDCETDNDCVKPDGFERAECVQLFDGRQCALPCRTDDDCATGTTCIGLERFDGGESFICQPEDA